MVTVKHDPRRRPERTVPAHPGDRPAWRPGGPPRSRATSPARRRIPTTRASVAEGFADAGATWLHVVDLDGARTGAPNSSGGRATSSRGGRPDARRARWGTPDRGGRGEGARNGRAPGSWWARPPSATRPSSGGSSVGTGRSGSRSRSMSATSSPSGRAGGAALQECRSSMPTAHHGRKGSRPWWSRRSGGTVGSRAPTSNSRAAWSATIGPGSSPPAGSARSTTSSRLDGSAAPARSSAVRSTRVGSTSDGPWRLCRQVDRLTTVALDPGGVVRAGARTPARTHRAAPRHSVRGGLELLAVLVDHLLGDVARDLLVMIELGLERPPPVGQ